ncbi:hypothetical protein QUW15_07035 [Desulfovibrio piger]|nr:hypothetical protein [Desulfovibrio piger]
MQVMRALLLTMLVVLAGGAAAEAAEERWPTFNLADPADEKAMELHTRSFHTHFTAVAGDALILYASRRMPIVEVVRHCNTAFANKKIDYSGTIYDTFTNISREELETMLQNGNILYFFPAFLAVNQHKGNELIREGLLSEKSVSVLSAALPLLSELVRNGELQTGMAAELRDSQTIPDSKEASRPAPRGATGR